MCNWRKSLKMFSQVSRISEELLKEKSATRFLFLTLTVKNVAGERLSETIDVMNKAFKYLFNEGLSFAPATVVKKNLLGYLRAMEVTYNSKSGEYHPHLHILLAVKPAYFSRDYVAQSQWREMWRKAMKLDKAGFGEGDSRSGEISDKNRGHHEDRGRRTGDRSIDNIA